MGVSAKGPNILLFIPDGLHGAVTDPGHPCIAPNLRALASRGTTFRNAHTTLPTCSPARASLMTGLLPHNHGVLQVEHVADHDQCVLRGQYPHWAQRLTERGYLTGYFGKWHVERSNRLEEYGWQANGSSEAAAHRSLGAGVANVGELLQGAPLVRYESGPEGYNDILHYAVTELPPEQRAFAHTVDRALGFLQHASTDGGPWACCVSFSEPNTPVVAGRAAFGHYRVEDMPLPSSIRDDLRGRPAMYRRVQGIYRDVTEREWRELRCCYYALVTELDAQLGRLLEWLDKNDQTEDTVVLFFSDHGRCVGAHGMDAHNFGAFEEAYRIPLVVAGPGVATGVVSAAQVSIADLAPTLVDLAGAEPISRPDSRSLARLLGDPGLYGTGFLTGYAEYHGTRFPLMQRVLWHESWKYVFNGFDYDELYDLESDPAELVNLAADPKHRDTCRALMARIWERARATGDRTILESHYSPMRFAVVGPNEAGPTAG